MKVTDAIFIIVSIPVVVLLTVALAQAWYVIGEERTGFDVTVTSSGVLGFNADTDALHFGTVRPGGGSERLTHLSSAHATKAVIRAHGPYWEWIYVEANTLFLEPNERVDVTFWIYPPIGTPSGNYSGEVSVTYYRRLPWE